MSITPSPSIDVDVSFGVEMFVVRPEDRVILTIPETTPVSVYEELHAVLERVLGDRFAVVVGGQVGRIVPDSTPAPEAPRPPEGYRPDLVSGVPQRPARRYPKGLGECLDCMAPLDSEIYFRRVCPACGSEAIRIYEEEL